jgi:hypothetical protein
MASSSPGIVLLVVGLLMAIIGGVTWGSCVSQPALSGTLPDCTGLAIILVIGVLLFIAGLVFLAVQYTGHTTRIQQAPDPSVPPPIIHPVVIEQTIEKDVVKVRCQYCGNLCEVTTKACPSCGAPIG